MNSVKLTKARLVPQTGDPIEVQFNPVSLVYEVSNSLAQQNRDATRRQLVTQSNARLSVELQFDSTTTGPTPAQCSTSCHRLCASNGARSCSRA
jgi:hypothetical protein